MNLLRRACAFWAGAAAFHHQIRKVPMRKALYAAFALAAYVTGLASILYLMGFLVDAVAPKSIDSGPSGPWMPALLIDFAVPAAFAVLHSVMARPAFKSRWTRIIPPVIERPTYILISGLSTFALVWAWQPLSQTLWLVVAFHTHHADLQSGALGVVCRFCAGCSLRSVVLRRR